MKLKFFSKLLLGVAAALSLASCSIDDDTATYVPNTNVAYGLIVNASPNSGNLYFFADENRINQTAANYTDAFGYFDFSLGSRALSIKNEAGEVLATDTITLTAGQYFSVFAVNTFDDIEIVPYLDVLEYPAANNARVRFINLSPDAASINIDSPSLNLATDLSFKEATDYIEVPGNAYSFTFKNTVTGAPIYTTEAISLEAGRIYTIYTKGFVTPPTGSNDTFSTKTIRQY